MTREEKRIIKGREVYRDYVLLDLRDRSVFELEHIDGAFNWTMQLSEEDKTDEARIEKKQFYKLLGIFNKWKIKKSALIEIYCYGGDCAERVAERFRNHGYYNAVNIGGYLENKEALKQVKNWVFKKER